MQFRPGDAPVGGGWAITAPEGSSGASSLLFTNSSALALSEADGVNTFDPAIVTHFSNTFSLPSYIRHEHRAIAEWLFPHFKVLRLRKSNTGQWRLESHEFKVCLLGFMVSWNAREPFTNLHCILVSSRIISQLGAYILGNLSRSVLTRFAAQSWFRLMANSNNFCDNTFFLFSFAKSL